MNRLRLLFLACLLMEMSVPLRAGQIIRNLTFATVGGTALQLDLYLPEESPPAGLIVWVHGGAWRGGSRESVDLKDLTARGWAVASVDYRLSTVARFPAQIHDIKAAIRFLRAHAADYGYPASRFAIAGSSAGGHLAALAGVTNGNAELEGSEGDATGTSSAVQAIVDLYGASNLTTILAQSTPHGLAMRGPALELLLGGQPDALPELARLASPVFHVNAAAPPLLLEHGDQDPQMPVNQALELQGAYETHGRPVVLKVMHGSGHGGPAFTDDTSLGLIDAFLRHQLPPADTATAVAAAGIGPGTSDSARQPASEPGAAPVAKTAETVTQELTPFKELIRAYEPNQLGLTQDEGDSLFMDFTLSLMFPLFHTYYPDLAGSRPPGFATFGSSMYSMPQPYFTATVRGGQYIGTRYSSPVVAKRFNPQFVLRSWTFKSLKLRGTKEALDNFVEVAYGHESNGQSISNPDRFNELFQVNLNNEKNPTDPVAIERARLSARDSISRGWDYVGVQIGWGRSEEEKNAPKAWEKLPGVFTLRAKFSYYLKKGFLQGEAEEYNTWEADPQGKPRRLVDGISLRLTGTIPLLAHTRTPAWFHLENRWALTWTTGYTDPFRYNTFKIESGLKLINLPVLVWYRTGYNSDLVDYYRKDHSWGLMVSFWEF
jgi:acetyl esterase/lipase